MNSCDIKMEKPLGNWTIVYKRLRWVLVIIKAVTHIQ